MARKSLRGVVGTAAELSSGTRGEGALGGELKAKYDASRITESVAITHILTRDVSGPKIDPIHLNRTNGEFRSDANIHAGTGRSGESSRGGIDGEIRERRRRVHSSGLDTH